MEQEKEKKSVKKTEEKKTSSNVNSKKKNATKKVEKAKVKKEPEKKEKNIVKSKADATKNDNKESKVVVQKKVAKKVNEDTKVKPKVITKTEVSTKPKKNLIEKKKISDGKVAVEKVENVEKNIKNKDEKKIEKETKVENNVPKKEIDKKVTPKKEIKVTTKKVIPLKKEEEKPKRRVMEITNRDFIFVFIIAICVIVALAIMGFVGNIVNKNKKDKALESDIDNIRVNMPENTSIDDKGNFQNNSIKLNEQKAYNGLVFKDVKLVKNSESCIYTATVENTTSQNYLSEIIELVFVDKNGNELGMLKAFVKDLIPGETDNVVSSITTNIVSAYDYIIKANT